MEFMACKSAAIIGLKMTEWLDNSGMFFVYFLIQSTSVFCIYLAARKGFDVSITVAVLISIAAIYNVLMIAPYYGYTVFGFSGEQMYNAYTNILGFIMLMQLFYMASYNKLLISKLGKYARTYTIFTDRFFMSYRRTADGGLV